MNRPTILLITTILASPLIAADMAESNAQREKKLQDLSTLRNEAAADQRKILANAANLRKEIEPLRREYVKVEKRLSSVPTDKKETDRDGKPDRGAIEDNRKHDQERRDLLRQLAQINGRARGVQIALNAAESAYNAALARTYQLDEQWMALADRFGRLSRAEHLAAMPLWDGWVAANSGDIGPLIGRGLANQHLGQSAMALADFNRAIEIVGNPKSKPGELYQPLLVSAYGARAKLQLAEGRERESAKDFSSAFSIDPKKNQLSSFLFPGMAECMQKKFGGAVLKFTKATQVYPEEAEGYRLLALVYAASPTDSVRNRKKAVESAQKACDLTKNADWACLYALAAAQAEAKDFTRAAKLAGQAADLTFDEHRTECFRCQAEYQQQRPLRMQWK